MIVFEKHPKICHFCGGNVELTSNAKVYGKEYGNGKCYLCTNCGAYVGVHTGTKTALGILANQEMRDKKIKCHDLFDNMWKSNKKRNELYKRLANEMQIERSHCHFGHFDANELDKAYDILIRWSITHEH